MASLVLGIAGAALGPTLFGTGFSVLGATLTGAAPELAGDDVARAATFDDPHVGGGPGIVVCQLIDAADEPSRS